jgi:hypothetical protein
MSPAKKLTAGEKQNRKRYVLIPSRDIQSTLDGGMAEEEGGLMLAAWL